MKEQNEEINEKIQEEINEEIQEEATEKTAEEQAPQKEQDIKEKLAVANDSYLRLAAEFDNYRRRTAKERLDLISTANEEIIIELLPIVDDFERALSLLKESKDSDAAKEGTSLIYNKIVAFLKKNGVEAIEAIGNDFDTDFHEAIAQIPIEDKKKKNKVIDLAQKGYTMGGKVIRYAKVVIGI